MSALRTLYFTLSLYLTQPCFLYAPFLKENMYFKKKSDEIHEIEKTGLKLQSHFHFQVLINSTISHFL